MGHVPANFSKLFSRFLDFPHHTIRAEVTGRRVNRGAGYGLEIPVRYTFYGKIETINLVKKYIEKICSDCEKSVKKYMK